MPSKAAHYLSVLVCFVLIGCNQLNLTDEGFDEAAQSVGETVADLDNALSGISTREFEDRTLIARGYCWQAATWFGSCSSGVRTRDFDGCSRGGTVWDGTVTLTFSDATCTMQNVDDTITRTTSDLSVTGRKGYTLSVSSATTTAYDGTEISGGQKITKKADNLSFDVLGITRIARDANGTAVFNISRKTTEAMTVSGPNRLNRTVTGGTLVAYHNLAQWTASWVPTNVTWNAECRCPVSGTMVGTLTGTKTGTLNLEFTGCGTVTITKEGVTADVTLDSCSRVSS